MPTKQELLAQLKELMEAIETTERDLRVMAYTHKCMGKTLLCCGEYRCEGCHTEHLNTTHSELGKDASAHFSTTKNLIFGERKREVLTLCGRLRSSPEAAAKHQEKCLDCKERAIDPLAKRPRGFLKGVKQPAKEQVKETPLSKFDSMPLEEMEATLAKLKAKLAR